MSAEQPEIDLDYVANLARLRLSPAEKAEFSGQLEKILDYFQVLKEVDVEGVEPMAHAFALDNVWQADVAQPGFSPAEALSNAPAARHDQIVVPKVVDDA
jgi:aspartyl-tRNA(Asn)/glutamyl-tRNA(Gln) amidotransferase subunit C